LKNGASVSVIAADILGSLEYQQDLVKGYYLHYLDRPADASGMQYFINSMTQGASDQNIVAAILGSAEYYGKTAS
jgi:hypothetical protein